MERVQTYFLSHTGGAGPGSRGLPLVGPRLGAAWDRLARAEGDLLHGGRALYRGQSGP